jgi:predicted dinucleotide-binding enzyme
MKIAIIGTGNIGAGLGRRWAMKGHQIVYGVRDPSTALAPDLLKHTGAFVRAVADAVALGEVIVLAIPYQAVPEIAKEIDDWRGRIVIDCTNALGPGPSLTAGKDSSAAERNAGLLAGALLVKSFNAQGAENIDSPVYGNVKATNFYCGDDAAAKEVVRGLILDVGFEPIDLGPLRSAHFLEALTLVWLAASRSLGARRLAFKLLSDASQGSV